MKTGLMPKLLSFIEIGDENEACFILGSFLGFIFGNVRGGSINWLNICKIS